MFHVKALDVNLLSALLTEAEAPKKDTASPGPRAHTWSHHFLVTRVGGSIMEADLEDLIGF